jgi:hypothetical protein
LAIIAGGAVYYILAAPERSVSDSILAVMSFALGVVISSGLNVLKMILIERATRKTLDTADEKAGKNYVRFQFIIRYVLSIVVLLAAALIPFINIWGAILGLFTLHIGAFSMKIFKLDKSFQ